MATSPDVETLERETAEARARLASTLDTLTSPQTTNAVKQELTDYAQGLKDSVIGSGRDKAQGFADDMKHRALANPIGVLMIGAGIGWHLYRHPPITTLLVGTGIALLMKGGDARRIDRSAYRDPYDETSPRGYVPGGVAGYGYPVKEDAPSPGIGDRVSAAASHAGEIAQDFGAKVRDTAHDVAERVSDVAGDVKASVMGAAETVRSSVLDATETARTTVSEAVVTARSATSDMIERGSSAASHAHATTARRASGAFDEALHQARSNPLLLGALGVAAGTALMYALRSSDGDDRVVARSGRANSRNARSIKSRSSAARAESRSPGYRSPDARSAESRSAGEMRSSGSHRVSDTAGGLASSAADMASGMAGTASRAFEAASDTISSSAGDAYEAASSAYRSAADMAYSAARRAPRAAGVVQQQVSELGERYPLLLGVASLALGAAVGGALHLSESENRLMGPLSDKLKQRAREAADEQFGMAREAAEHLAGELQTQFAGNGQDQDKSADFETVIGGGKPAAAQVPGSRPAAPVA